MDLKRYKVLDGATEVAGEEVAEDGTVVLAWAAATAPLMAGKITAADDQSGLEEDEDGGGDGQGEGADAGTKKKGRKGTKKGEGADE